MDSKGECCSEHSCLQRHKGLCTAVVDDDNDTPKQFKYITCPTANAPEKDENFTEEAGECAKHSGSSNIGDW